MDGDLVLKLVNIKKRFGGNEVLKGISLGVLRHEVVALIGASGSGKSTLLRCVNLLERIDDGQIFLSREVSQGEFKLEDISDPRTDEDSVRGRIGIVFQNYNLFPHLTVLDNVTLASRMVLKVPREKAEADGMELLKRIGIGHKAKVYPDQLSGGQQQRVAIVRAISSDPELLLLDEITSALDPQLVGEVLDLVKELKDSKATIVMATHEMSFAKNVSDRVIFLDKGVIAEEGPPEKLFNAPEKRETKDFLSRIHF